MPVSLNDRRARIAELHARRPARCGELDAANEVARLAIGTEFADADTAKKVVTVALAVTEKRRQYAALACEHARRNATARRIMGEVRRAAGSKSARIAAQAGAEVDTEDLFAAIYPYEIEALNDARRGLPGSAADLAVAIGEFHKAACRTIFANAKGLSV